jgi:hypothetical protein
MLPLLLLQLFYKLVWLLAVALPLWSTGEWDATATEFTTSFVIAVVLDVVVIPWGYVLRHYVNKPGDAWKLPGALRKTTPQPSGRT